MEKDGLLRRTHGGAVLLEPLIYEAFRHDRSFQDQVGSFAKEKQRIAESAAALVSPGDTIALTAGTTTTEVVRHLRRISGITVVTNTVNVAMELGNRKDIDVYVTGGHLRGDWFFPRWTDCHRSCKRRLCRCSFSGGKWSRRRTWPDLFQF